MSRFYTQPREGTQRRTGTSFAPRRRAKPWVRGCREVSRFYTSGALSVATHAMANVALWIANPVNSVGD